MHQEHTIPWNKLASNFQFVRDNPHYTPRVTALWFRQRPSQKQDIEYFKRVLAQTIRTFADTERKKYDADPKLPASGLMFSEELRERYRFFSYELRERYGNGDLKKAPNKGNQKLEYWEKVAWIDQWDPSKPPRPYYHHFHHDFLADVVEVLLLENEILPLLILARNPKVPIRHLINMGQSWNWGFSRIMNWALYAYVLVNLCAAIGVLDDGGYLETTGYKEFMWNMESDRFCTAIARIFDQYMDPVGRDPVWNRPMLHKDYPRLREYMKLCFAILYRYDVVLRECGVDPDWDQEITRVLRCIGRGR